MPMPCPCTMTPGQVDTVWRICSTIELSLILMIYQAQESSINNKFSILIGSSFILRAMQIASSGSATATPAQVQAARDALDATVREVVAWHFDPATGCPFWLDFAKKLNWDPLREVHSFADLKRFGQFEDEWLR